MCNGRQQKAHVQLECSRRKPRRQVGVKGKTIEIGRSRLVKIE